MFGGTFGKVLRILTPLIFLFTLQQPSTLAKLKKSQVLQDVNFASELNVFEGEQELELNITTSKAIKKVIAKFKQKQAKQDKTKHTKICKTNELVSQSNGEFLYQLSIPFDQSKALGDWYLYLKLIGKNKKQIVYKARYLDRIALTNKLTLISEQQDSDDGASTEEEPSDSKKGPTPGPGNPSPEPEPEPTEPEPEPESLLKTKSLDPVNADALEDASSLYHGSGAVQTGVDESIMDDTRIAIVRGKVFAVGGDPLANVVVKVHHHAEFGQTKTFKNGEYNFALNGGAQVVFEFSAPGYLTVQRRLTVPRRDYWVLEDIFLTKLDSHVNQIDLHSVGMQVAEADPVTDEEGTRQAVVIVPPQTNAKLILPDGSSQSLDTATLRATEFTVGPNGLNAMPGNLPPVSGYTYALELSLDEAIEAGASKVEFDRPLPFYVDNFLDFPVGEPVPVGYYDREQSRWIAANNGRIIKILRIEASKAVLDLTGDGIEATTEELEELQINTDELFELASRYEAGKTLWRVLIEHFTPWDCNWPYGPPGDAVPPPEEAPEQDDENDPDDPCKQSGSIIECESQNLGEVVPLTGTGMNLHYNTARVPGRKTGRTLRIKLADDREIPGSLEEIELTIRIAGKKINKIFPANAEQEYIYTWDGKDVYGREVFGSMKAHIDLDYKYKIQYYASNDDFQRSFALANNDDVDSPARVIGERGNETLRLTRSYTKTLYNNDVNSHLGFGGWSLSKHHYYDPHSGALFKGDGEIVHGDKLGDLHHTIYHSQYAGSGLVYDVAVGPDGSIFFARYNSIYKISSNGSVSKIAGGLLSSADGTEALDFYFTQLRSIEVNQEGEIYFLDHKYIAKIGKSNKVEVIAKARGGRASDGTRVSPEVEIGSCLDIQLDHEGNLFFYDFVQLRKIDGDGILSTIAGRGGWHASRDDNIPALEAQLYGIGRFDITDDGTIYISMGNKIKRISPEGIITTFAGQEGAGFDGDGGLAVDAKFNYPTRIAHDSLGNIYVLDSYNDRIRLISPDGYINTYAGKGRTSQYDTKRYNGYLATDVYLRLAHGVEVDSQANLYISDSLGGSRVRKISPAFPGYGKTKIVMPNRSGTEYYIFNKKGKHLQTIDALTNKAVYDFAYNGNYLIQITDSYGNKTVIDREGKEIRSITSTYGLRTDFSLGIDGYLSSVTNPESDVHQFSYYDKGLLKNFTNPRGYSSTMTYDDKGRLVKDENAAGGSWTLSREKKVKRAYKVVMESAEGKKQIHNIKKHRDGSLDRIVTRRGDQVAKQVIKKDGTHKLTKADGTKVETKVAPDPRFKMLAPVVSEIKTTLPSGLEQILSVSRSAKFTNSNDLTTLKEFTETRKINDRSFKQKYIATDNTLSSTSPEARFELTQFGANGQILSVAARERALLTYDYDERGRILSIARTADAETRETKFEYNDDGYLSTITDAEGNLSSYSRDLVGRIQRQYTNSKHELEYDYDENSNLKALDPPSDKQHQFDYDPVDLLTQYEPPVASDAAKNSTDYSYDLDKKLTSITLPDLRTVEFSYDPDNKEELTKLSIDRGDIEYQYYGSGQLKSIVAPGAEVIKYKYDGELPIAEDLDGTVDGDFWVGYNKDFKPSSITVNGSATIGLAYDKDGFLTKAGDLAIELNADNAFVEATTINGMVTSYRHNGFGETLVYQANYAGNSLYSENYTRDKLGRIKTRIETIQGTVTNYAYSYDDQGRLSEFYRNGTKVRDYEYDVNDNRIKVNGVSVADYDDQDRLLSYDGTSYSYDPNGNLVSKTKAQKTTHYSYDELGNLLSVTKSGTQIEYIVDGNNRRIAKKLNGLVVQRLLYKNQLEPIAELDAAGNVITRYIYGEKSHVPAYMIKAGKKYRIVSDHLGSVRLVVDLTTGSVVQRLDYDEFGNVTRDSNPGFQAFGFAGGLYDRDTGLVKFGARDYDPEIGRWISKDPILFNGGQVNLYIYVGGDSVNSIDITGEARFGYGPLVFFGGWIYIPAY
ncbi:MAG: hypothetical protein OXU45_00225, partial [Candidatus Melainabacteria bacterium]|nr:hypothetical protein [Candidatus Melainabacteria bacterium]